MADVEVRHYACAQFTFCRERFLRNPVGACIARLQVTAVGGIFYIRFPLTNTAET